MAESKANSPLFPLVGPCNVVRDARSPKEICSVSSWGKVNG